MFKWFFFPLLQQIQADSNISSMALLYPSPTSVLFGLALLTKQDPGCLKHTRQTFLRVLEAEVQDQGG